MSKIKTTYIYDDETDTAEIVELWEISCKKEKSLKASRDYWKEKAETATKENAILKWKLENAYLELKIWSNGMVDYLREKETEFMEEDTLQELRDLGEI